MEATQPERIVLAGDMALRFGLAIGSTTRGYLGSTVIDVQKQRDETGLGRAFKFAQIKTRMWVQRLGITKVDRVVYEEPTTSRGNPVPQYGMVTTLFLAGDDLGCWLASSYWPITLKKFSTGNHKADKSLMVAAANRWTCDKLAREIIDDNEADAVLLLKLAIAELNGEYVRPKKKRKPRKGAKKQEAKQSNLF